MTEIAEDCADDVRYAVVKVQACRGCPHGELVMAKFGVAGVRCRIVGETVRASVVIVPHWCPLPKESPL